MIAQALIALEQDKPAFALLVEKTTKEMLATANNILTTVDVVERLWPPHEIRGPAMAATRQQIFSVLSAGARDGKFAGYVTKGAGKLNKFKRTIHPWHWHAPVTSALPKCPHCGGVL